MTIFLTDLEQNDYDEFQRLIKDFYLELGEDAVCSSRYAKLLATQANQDSDRVIIMKKFVTNQMVGFGFLTELKSSSASKYGVFDQVFLIKPYRTSFFEEEIQLGAKSLGEKKKLHRMDIATPTDAWYRTVRYFTEQSLRLTAPKFKRIFQMSKAA